MINWRISKVSFDENNMKIANVVVETDVTATSMMVLIDLNKRKKYLLERAAARAIANHLNDNPQILHKVIRSYIDDERHPHENLYDECKEGLIYEGTWSFGSISSDDNIRFTFIMKDDFLKEEIM